MGSHPAHSAFVFWADTVAAGLQRFGWKPASTWCGVAAGLQRFGWKPASTWFSQQPEPLQIALLVAGFCLIAASVFVVQRFDLPVLRFLEGYWHPWLRPLRRWLIAKEAKRSQRISDRWHFGDINLSRQHIISLNETNLSPMTTN